jgi:hypothetical protein
VILEDFIMLGTTVPEPSSKYGLSVCSAGWSAELGGLVRIYPLKPYGAPSRWSINRVQLERNPKDSRSESWKLVDDRSADGRSGHGLGFECVGQVPQSRRRGLLDQVVVDSISEANERRISLCVVHPASCPQLTFEYNPDSPDSPQLSLFDRPDRPTAGSKRFPYTPRLQFVDGDGEHHLKVRDWGAFEFLRKEGVSARHKLNLNLRTDSSLLLGNLVHQRNAWLVISVLNGVRDAQPSLFSLADATQVA